MDDNTKELLTLAAKACGIEFIECDDFGIVPCSNPSRYWNPKADDGDSARMRVRAIHRDGKIKTDWVLSPTKWDSPTVRTAALLVAAEIQRRKEVTK